MAKLKPYVCNNCGKGYREDQYKDAILHAKQTGHKIRKTGSVRTKVSFQAGIPGIAKGEVEREWLD